MTNSSKRAIIKLIDDEITDIPTDQYVDSEGCPTCGHGRRQITELCIEFRDNANIHFEFVNNSQTVGHVLKMFIDSLENIKLMTYDEFREWIPGQLGQKISW